MESQTDSSRFVSNSLDAKHATIEREKCKHMKLHRPIDLTVLTMNHYCNPLSNLPSGAFLDPARVQDMKYEVVWFPQVLEYKISGSLLLMHSEVVGARELGFSRLG